MKWAEFERIYRVKVQCGDSTDSTLSDFVHYSTEPFDFVKDQLCSLYLIHSYTKPFVYRNPLSTKTLCLLRDTISHLTNTKPLLADR